MSFYKKVIGITGISGALGNALCKRLKEEGAFIIGFSHKTISPSKKLHNTKLHNKSGPDEIVIWEIGKEKKLEKYLKKLDIFIINHGINLNGIQTDNDFLQSIEVNAMSVLRLINTFENVKIENQIKSNIISEIWINTSESEYIPSLSMSYELSKRLIGQIISYKLYTRGKSINKKVIIRKLILGSFKSNLNPIGIMDPYKVADNILRKSYFQKNIIVSPFVFTNLLAQICEFYRKKYYQFINKLNQILRKK